MFQSFLHNLISMFAHIHSIERLLQSLVSHIFSLGQETPRGSRLMLLVKISEIRLVKISTTIASSRNVYRRGAIIIELTQLFSLAGIDTLQFSNTLTGQCHLGCMFRK